MRTRAATDERYMREALEHARVAAELGETPVGALLVHGGTIFGVGHNRVETDSDPTAHAEILALRQAAQRNANWRLLDATLYVTLEPCVMCAAALIHARVKRVVFGAFDDRWGGLGSLFDLSHDPRLNHELEVVSGVMKDEAAQLLQRFFRDMRGRIDEPKRRDARVVEGG